MGDHGQHLRRLLVQVAVIFLACTFSPSNCEVQPQAYDLLGRRVQGERAKGAEAEDEQKRVNISRGEPDTTVSRNTAIIAGCLGALLCLSLAALLLWRRQQKVQEVKDEEEGPAEIKEWLYQFAGTTKGPHTNSEMQQFCKKDEIGRSTKAKVVWWTRDFTEISTLFPEVGTEFQVPAQADAENVHSQWHRYSVHARPRGAGAEILPQMLWYYLSPAGEMQGPFETGKMRHWHIEGFFPDVTPLQMILDGGSSPPAVDANAFRPLKELFPDLTKAFDTMPAARTEPVAPPPQMLGNAASAGSHESL